MVFKFLLVVCAFSAVSSQIVKESQDWTPVQPAVKSNEEAQQQTEHTDRVGRFMNLKKLYTADVETNEIDVEKKEETGNPDEALAGLYSECVMQFSLPCIQKKFLVFLDRLGRMDSFSILGDFLSVKRTGKETTKPITEKAIEARMNYHKSEEDLELLVDYAIERFFNNHKLRIKLPFGLSVADSTATGRSSTPESNAIDIGFARGFSEGRGKKKKMMMMMMMMMKMKMLAILPMIAMMIKLKALKALILSKMALFLAMLSLLKKKMMKDDKHKIVIIHDPHHGSSGVGRLKALPCASAGSEETNAFSQLAKLTFVSPDCAGREGSGDVQTSLRLGSSTTTCPCKDLRECHRGHHDSYGPPSGGGWSSGGDSYSSGGDHGGGWGRSWSQSDAHTLAYRAHNVTGTT